MNTIRVKLKRYHGGLQAHEGDVVTVEESWGRRLIAAGNAEEAPPESPAAQPEPPHAAQ